MNSVISIESFSKSFGSLCAVDSISLEVDRGTVFCFLGTNGAGKTTTIKALTGQLEISSGKISVLGMSLPSQAQELFPKIGVVGDFQQLYRQLTVEENLQFFCDLYGLNRKRVAEVSDELDLNHKLSSKVQDLSKGLTQRALLAKSILHQPEILFLDEPSTGLDPISTLDLHRIILSLKDKGTTVFLTTHGMEEADKLADQICFIHKGRIVENGPPNELKRKYGKPTIKATFKTSHAEKTLDFPLSQEGLQQLSIAEAEATLLSVRSQEASLHDIFVELLSKDELCD